MLNQNLLTTCYQSWKISCNRVLIFFIVAIDLVNMGARYDIYVAKGDWWRFITPNFLHIGITHLLLNLAGLFIFGMLVEKDFSKIKYIIIYFFCGGFFQKKCCDLNSIRWIGTL